MKQTLLIIALSLVMLQTNAQAKRNYHSYGIHASYLLSANKKNVEENKPLFAGNAISVGASHRWGNKLSIYTMAQYTNGKLDNTSLNNYAKSVSGGKGYEINKTSISWSQLSLLTGPSLQFFPKFPFNVNLLGGIACLPNRNTIKVIGNAPTPLLSSTEKSIMFLWNMNANLSLLRINKKMDLGLSFGYGNNGLSVGIVSSDTYAICCRKGTKACCDMAPKH